jgi:WD40 repeat protein
MFIRCCSSLFVLLTPLLGLADAPGKPRLDAHGFPLPDGAIARLGDLRFVSPEAIRALALSHDGKRIASAGNNIHLWDADTGRMLRTIKTSQESMRILAFSRNGRLLAAMSRDAELSVWDVVTGEPYWVNKVRMPAETRSVSALRFTDNDRLLGIVLDGCRVRLWDVPKATLFRTWEVDDAKQAQLKKLGKGYAFASVSLSPSGELMAWLVSPHRSVKKGRSAVAVYETVSGHLKSEVKGLRVTETVHLIDEGQTLVLDPTWHRTEGTPDEATARKYAVIEIPGGQVRFHVDYRWPVLSGEATAYFPAMSFVEARDVFQSGKSLFTDDRQGLARWDLTTGKKLAEWDDITCLAHSADGKRIVASRNGRLYLGHEERQPIRTSTEFADAPFVEFLSDGRLATQAGWQGCLNVWDLQQGKIVETLWRHHPPAWRRYCDYDAWGKVFAYHTEQGPATHDLVADRRLCSLDLTGVKAKAGWIGHFHLSPDGSRVLVRNEDKDGLVVRWFDSRSGREEGRCVIAENEQFPTTRWVRWFSAKGNTFGYVTADSRLALVDCPSGKVSQLIGIAVPPSQKDAQSELAQRPWNYESAGFDQLILATRDSMTFPLQKEFVLWDRTKGHMMRRFHLRGEQLDHRRRTCLSQDGRLMALYTSGDREVTIHETATGSARGVLQAPSGVHSVDFSPDGKTLSTGCADTTVLVWEMNRPLSTRLALPATRNRADGERLWKGLAEPSAATAEQAIWALVRSPEQTLTLLHKELKPIRSPGPERLQALITQLNSPNFQLREMAVQELEVLGELAAPALRTAMQKDHLTLEQKRRALAILERLEEPGAIPPCLRELRAVEVLERIGNAESRRLLETLASGSTDALLTHEARLALARLQRKQAGG